MSNDAKVTVCFKYHSLNIFKGRIAFLSHSCATLVLSNALTF